MAGGGSSLKGAVDGGAPTTGCSFGGDGSGGDVLENREANRGGGGEVGSG
jgi:hypothetical protein